MKHLVVGLALTVVLFFSSPAAAIIYQIDFSPAADRALNLGTVIYPGDGAPGLSPMNEPSLPMPATGSGDEIGAGITYDTDTMQLSLNFAYGSVFGFTSLSSDLNTAAAGGIHIHGAANPGSNTGIVFNLSTLGLFTSAGTNGDSGSVAGAITLDDAQETILFNNQYYVNVHSLDNPGGEIRGQLVIVPEPASLLLLACGALGLAAARRRRK